MSWLFAGSDVAAIYKHFAENRPTLPLMYIVTPNSKMTSPFTRHVPTAQILTRVATLARAAFAALETQLLSCDSDSKDFKVGSHPNNFIKKFNNYLALPVQSTCSSSAYQAYFFKF